MSLLEQDTTRKERVDKKVTELDFEAGNSKKYKVEAIRDNIVYTNESESGHPPGFYYLVAWKGYPEEENIWELSSAVQHLKKLISFFHKDYPEKSTATSPPIDSAPPIARSTVKPMAKATTKQKQGRSAHSANKQAKNWTDTSSCDNKPLIHWGLDGSSFFAKFFIFSNLIYKNIGFSPQSHPIG